MAAVAQRPHFQECVAKTGSVVCEALESTAAVFDVFFSFYHVEFVYDRMRSLSRAIQRKQAIFFGARFRFNCPHRGGTWPYGFIFNHTINHNVLIITRTLEHPKRDPVWAILA